MSRIMERIMLALALMALIGKSGAIKTEKLSALILAKDSNSSCSYSYGTAFPVAPHVWLTAAHVVEDAPGKGLILPNKNGFLRGFKIRLLDKESDMAVLYCDKAVRHWYPIETNSTADLQKIRYPSHHINFEYRLMAVTKNGKAIDGQSGSPFKNSTGKVDSILVASGDSNFYLSPITEKMLSEIEEVEAGA